MLLKLITLYKTCPYKSLGVQVQLHVTSSGVFVMFLAIWFKNQQY